MTLALPPVRIPGGIGPVDSARLPEMYSNAKASLAECYRVDQCKDWTDKAEALRSYAKQAHDDELVKTAMRIKGRAAQRLGELLEAIEKTAGGRPQKQVDARQPVLTARQAAAAAAGLSRSLAQTHMQHARELAKYLESRAN